MSYTAPGVMEMIEARFRRGSGYDVCIGNAADDTAKVGVVKVQA